MGLNGDKLFSGHVHVAISCIIMPRTYSASMKFEATIKPLKC
jgi:hypothetical protein